MENEELNLVQILKNIYLKKSVLFKILIIFTIIALGYALINDMIIKETTAVIVIDKVDNTTEDTITSLDTAKVKTSFDKTKKTITFSASGIDSLNCELQVENQINVVREKLEEIYSIGEYKEIQEITTEHISIVKIIKDILIFEIIGVALYIGYVFLSTSFTTTTDEYVIQNITKLKVLGKLYKKDENLEKSLLSKYISSEENISMEKQLRIIKTNIELRKDNKEPKVILFASADKRVKNDEVIRLLAKEYSTDNKKIMILAYDIANYENIGLNAVETMKLADNDSTIEEAESLIEELNTKYDIIFIDGSNINENHLSIIFASMADSNIIIAKTEKTRIEDIIKTKQYIEDVDGKISGIILNKM